MSPTETLAPGAPPAAGFIPLIVPEICGNEWEYVKECLDTNWVSSVGTYVDRFEKMMAEHAGTKYAVATVNGTAALHIALMLAGVEPNDEVLVSTLTFIAPANAIRYVGAWPVFIDAESKYWQIDPAAVADFLENHCRRDGKCTRKSKDWAAREGDPARSYSWPPGGFGSYSGDRGEICVTRDRGCDRRIRRPAIAAGASAVSVNLLASASTATRSSRPAVAACW